MKTAPVEKTIFDWFNDLPEDIKRVALKRLYDWNDHNDPTAATTWMLTRTFPTLMSAGWHAFSWSDSPEKHKFWRTVFEKNINPYAKEINVFSGFDVNEVIGNIEVLETRAKGIMDIIRNVKPIAVRISNTIDHIKFTSSRVFICYFDADDRKIVISFPTKWLHLDLTGQPVDIMEEVMVHSVVNEMSSTVGEEKSLGIENLYDVILGLKKQIAELTTRIHYLESRLIETGEGLS